MDNVDDLDNVDNVDDLDNVYNVDKMDNIGQPKRQPKRPLKKQPKSQSTFLYKQILDKTILDMTI